MRLIFISYYLFCQNTKQRITTASKIISQSLLIIWTTSSPNCSNQGCEPWQIKLYHKKKPHSIRTEPFFRYFTTIRTVFLFDNIISFFKIKRKYLKSYIYYLTTIIFSKICCHFFPFYFPTFLFIIIFYNKIFSIYKNCLIIAYWKQI